MGTTTSITMYYNILVGEKGVIPPSGLEISLEKNEWIIWTSKLIQPIEERMFV